jgi:hypothetical protein
VALHAHPQRKDVAAAAAGGWMGETGLGGMGQGRAGGQQVFGQKRPAGEGSACGVACLLPQLVRLGGGARLAAVQGPALLPPVLAAGLADAALPAVAKRLAALTPRTARRKRLRAELLRCSWTASTPMLSFSAVRCTCASTSAA